MLVVAAVLLTAAAMVALTFGGPPPRPAPTQVAEIVAALETGRVERGIGRPMRISMRQERPSPAADQLRSPRLEDAIRAGLGSGEAVMAYSSERLAAGEPSGVIKEIRGTITVARRLGDRWQVLQSREAGTERQWLQTTAMAILAVLALIMLLAWRVVGSVTRPLRSLAQAAEATRVGQPWASTSGISPPEVASVEAALASFDARQRDHLRQQTAMLAAVAHDLGTPLTRLAFRVEGLPEHQRDAANADIALMRGLIGNSLALARSTMARNVAVDFSGLVETVVTASWQPQSPVSASCEPALAVQGEPVALQCVVQNLVDNMQRYAGGGVLMLRAAGGLLVLRAEDSGPGFPVHLLGELGSPFVRGDPSRNADTGGSGLGLAIARTIAERHGGGLTLGNRAGRGAWVEVRLPLGQADV